MMITTVLPVNLPKQSNDSLDVMPYGSGWIFSKIDVFHFRSTVKRRLEEGGFIIKKMQSDIELYLFT